MTSPGRPIRLAPQCVAFPADDPAWVRHRALAEQIEASTFSESFGETAENLRSYYRDHLPQSRFVLAGHQGWAGMMRIALPGPLPSLSLEDAVGSPFDADLSGLGAVPRVLDILTAAVLPRRRVRGVLERMLAVAVELATEHRCTHMLTMLDARLIGYLQARGTPMRVHSQPHPYYGSPATTVASSTPGEVGEWLRDGGMLPPVSFPRPRPSPE